MTAIDLLASALPPHDLPASPLIGRCCVLGTDEPTIARTHAIKPSFTNLDLLSAPDSERVSVRAWRVLTHAIAAAEGKKRDTFPLMQSSWICGPEGLRLLDRLAVRALVLDGVIGAPWCGYVTTSYKKHGALRAPVNHGVSQRWLFELDIIDCTDRARVQDWWTRLRETREAGIPRPVIETLDISVGLMGKHLTRWQTFERWAQPIVRSPLYRFLTYLLPSGLELGELNIRKGEELKHGQEQRREGEGEGEG